MSKELADKLINAASAAAFLREQDGAAGWQTLALLKTEVDRLIGADLKIAERLTDRIEQLAAMTDDPCSRAFADASRARILQHTGRYVEADVLYESAIKATRRAKLPGQAAVIQIHRVFALTQMGRYDEAMALGRAARRGLPDDSLSHLAQLETNIGIIHYRRDQYKQALTHYERAADLLASSEDGMTRAVVDVNRAHALKELDRPAEALRLFESAADLLGGAGQSLWAAQTRFHIAYLQFMRGNYNLALAAYHQSRDELTALGSEQLVAWCNQESAEILLALNAFDDAAERAAAARSSFTRLGLAYEAAQATLVHALALMGGQQFDVAQGDLEEARRFFAQNNNRTLAAQVDIYLAELALRRNNPAEAAERATSSLRIFTRQKLLTRAAYARTLVARAAFESSDLKRARQMAKATLASMEGLHAPAVAYQCHHLLGRIERQRGRRAPALASFRRAVDIVEQMRGGIVADEFKSSFLRDKVNAYEDAIAACLDADNDELLGEAFRLVESSKSRALADLLARYAQGSAASASSLQPALQARLVKLIEDLNWYNSQAGLAEDKGDQRSAAAADHYRHAVARCERQIAQLFRDIEMESPVYAKFQRLQTATAADLCDTLQSDETVVEYFTTGERVSAFVVTRQGVRVARNIAAKREVEQMLATLRFQIEKFNYGGPYIEAHFGQLRRATNETLSALYDAIFAPLAAMITGSRLIVIPHGMLHYVPFHALAAGDRYLIDDYEVSYAPSASVLKLCRARRAAAGSVRSNAAIANQPGATGAASSTGVAGDAMMVALGLAESGTPSITEEIRQLALLFPNSVTLTGAAATRENLFKAAPQARYLHLASHGFFRRDNPMFSFLKLADAQLNFYSLLDLQLNAELVTLSACHTGVNKIFPGDELHGLMRGFLQAGAPSVIASLWAVSDQSTAEMMRELYTGIRAGLSKRAALRRAQLAIKEAYGHPYYWAPFVLMGDPE